MGSVGLKALQATAGKLPNTGMRGWPFARSRLKFSVRGWEHLVDAHKYKEFQMVKR